jgi:hypothetical protein
MTIVLNVDENVLLVARCSPGVRDGIAYGTLVQADFPK